MATAPKDTPVKSDAESTAISMSDESAAGRRRKSRKIRRGGGWYSGLRHNADTAPPVPPTVPAGTLGGRRRHSS
jgi:hypothetical protein